MTKKKLKKKISNFSQYLYNNNIFFIIKKSTRRKFLDNNYLRGVLIKLQNFTIT